MVDWVLFPCALLSNITEIKNQSKSKHVTTKALYKNLLSLVASVSGISHTIFPKYRVEGVSRGEVRLCLDSPSSLGSALPVITVSHPSAALLTINGFMRLLPFSHNKMLSILSISINID